MAESAQPKVPRDGVLVFSDGTGTPITYTVKYEAGDFALDATNQGTTSYEPVHVFDRGDYLTTVKGQQRLIGFSFTAHACDFSDATDKLLMDMVKKTGAFAAGVSALGSSSAIWWTLTSLVWTIEGTNYGDGSDHTCTMTKVDLEIAVADGEPGKFTVTGTVKGTITWT